MQTFHEVSQVRHQLSGVSALAMDSGRFSAADDRTSRERRKKADLAAKRRAKVMAQMSRMQRVFIEENSDLFERTSTDLQRVASDMDVV